MATRLSNYFFFFSSAVSFFLLVSLTFDDILIAKSGKADNEIVVASKQHTFAWKQLGRHDKHEFIN